MNNNLLPIHFAPLQGYTDAVYRLAHARIFGGIDTYYSPFVRVEHGEIYFQLFWMMDRVLFRFCCTM